MPTIETTINQLDQVNPRTAFPCLLLASRKELMSRPNVVFDNDASCRLKVELLANSRHSVIHNYITGTAFVSTWTSGEFPFVL